MNYLGIDYGEAKVGVAIAEGPLAEPLTTLDTGMALHEIMMLVKKHNIAEIVVGDCPEEFLKMLQGWGLPVHQADETLSSHDARQALLHKSQKKRRENEHAVSAALILQNWLEINTSPQPSP